MDARRLSRREWLAGAAAAAGLAVGLERVPRAVARGAWARTVDFRSLPPGEGWPGWTCPGVANLRRRDGRGVLEAGSDVFPCDPRPVAFALDQRFVDGEVSALVEATGAGAGVVLRRTGPRDYYAAVYDAEQGALIVLRRFPEGVSELGRAPVPAAGAPLRLTLSARGTAPTALAASLEARDGSRTAVAARDAAPDLQRAGDPGVLATARTLFPSQGPPVLPALGNLHLLPYGVQEGQAVMSTPPGEALVAEIRRQSTAAFVEIAVRAADAPQPTRPSVIAATAAPLSHHSSLQVALDVPARVEVEVSADPRFRRSRRLRPGRTNAFGGAFVGAWHLPRGRRVYWRARMRRGGRESVGPVRSFRVLPGPGSREPATVAVGACATQFGPIFDGLAARRPDVFVWQGDLNYPDTLGPLAQTSPGYAGIWRDFLANPRLVPILERSAFAAQRDDHDYGLQDANSTNLVPWGLAPWEALVEPRPYYRFTAGLAEFWVLDQRRFKSDPGAPDSAEKTLLGRRQRRWLLRSLADSPAAFKVICSPCTLAPAGANRRDGSWAAGFTAERDLLLDHVRRHVGGRTLFVTGDTHWTMVYERDELFEARPCPLDIPTPNDITITQPQAAEDARRIPGVAYADDERGHFALVEVRGERDVARLDLALVRDDGATAYRRRFELPLPA